MKKIDGCLPRVCVFNLQSQTIVAPAAGWADTPRSRLVGLLNKESLGEEEALVITDCRSIHMFFMRFSIDVIFADKRGKVVGLVRGIKPFRLSPYFLKAYYAIEGSVGMISRTHTGIGDKIEFREVAE